MLQYIVELAAAVIYAAERLRRSQESAWQWSLIDHFPHPGELSPYPLTASGNLVVF